MAGSEKAPRLGRGLDALLARRDAKNIVPSVRADGGTAPNVAGVNASSRDQNGEASVGNEERAAHPAALAGPATAGGHKPERSKPPSAELDGAGQKNTLGPVAANPTTQRESTTELATPEGIPPSADVYLPNNADSAYATPTVRGEQTALHSAPTIARNRPNASAQLPRSQFRHKTEPDTPHASAHGSETEATTPDTSTRASTTTVPNAASYRLIPIAQIAPNPFQPRKEFHPQDLADLEASLQSQGLLQPITVRPSPHHTGYEIIAGERRLRAATRLGWKEIPAIVRDTDDRTMLTLAMVENLQRSDLDPIDEADGYQRLIDEFSATQQEVADVVGKERSTVANALRLLSLPASVKRLLQERQISVGHARALLPLETERAIADLARTVVAESLSVRDVEERVRGIRPTPAKSGRKAKTSAGAVTASTPAAAAELRRLEELLRRKMQTPVNLRLTGKERGEVRIAFYSNDDLERVLALLGIDANGEHA